MGGDTSPGDAGLGAVLRTALDAVVVMRLDGTVADWNEAAERTFGWPREMVVGRRMGDVIVPPRYRDAHERGLTHFLATGEGVVLDHRFEIEALHRDGRELPVELSITHTTQFGAPLFLGFLRDISERRDAARRQELMIGELNHRVKNLLGVVAGIAHQTARSSATVVEFTTAYNGRLAALGRAHEILSLATWEHASLPALVAALLGPHAEGAGAQLAIAGPEVTVGPRQLLSLGLILHELLTNAIKYGALAHPAGRVSVTWTTEDNLVHIKWIESGVSDVQPPTRAGFGSKMIALSAAHELRGTFGTVWHADGMAFTLSFAREEEVSR